MITYLLLFGQFPLLFKVYRKLNRVYFESVHHTSFILCLQVAKFFIHVPKDCISIEVFYIFDQVPSVISAPGYVISQNGCGYSFAG